MKIPPSLASICLAALAIPGAIFAAGTGGSLFNSGEAVGSVFGESANGTVDITNQPVTFHTTTTTTVRTFEVAGPTPLPSASPSPSSSPILELRSPGAKKAAARAAVAGTRLVDPTVTVTHKHRHTVNVAHHEQNAGGGGFSFAYFFTRYLGIRTELAFLGGHAFDTVWTGDLIFRYPFDFGAKETTSSYSKDGKETAGKDGKETTMGEPTWGLAPYILAGGGGQWGAETVGIADVGGGLEFRFRKHYGVYLEDRWVVHDGRQNYNAVTAGFSYNF